MLGDTELVVGIAGGDESGEQQLWVGVGEEPGNDPFRSDSSQGKGQLTQARALGRRAVCLESAS